MNPVSSCPRSISQVLMYDGALDAKWELSWLRISRRIVHSNGSFGRYLPPHLRTWRDYEYGDRSDISVISVLIKNNYCRLSCNRLWKSRRDCKCYIRQGLFWITFCLCSSINISIKWSWGMQVKIIAELIIHEREKIMAKWCRN